MTSTYAIKVIDRNTLDWTTRTLTGASADARRTLDTIRRTVTGPDFRADRTEVYRSEARAAVQGLSTAELAGLGITVCGRTHADMVDHLVWTHVGTLIYSRTA
jgi:hypothetical protein